MLTGARFPLAELTARVDGKRKPVTRQLGPSTRLVETGHKTENEKSFKLSYKTRQQHFYNTTNVAFAI